MNTLLSFSLAINWSQPTNTSQMWRCTKVVGNYGSIRNLWHQYYLYKCTKIFPFLKCHVFGDNCVYYFFSKKGKVIKFLFLANTIPALASRPMHTIMNIPTPAFAPELNPAKRKTLKTFYYWKYFKGKTTFVAWGWRWC